MSKVAKIEFRCTHKPIESVLSGFEENVTYKGRTFNGVYEISEEWASNKPVVVIEKRDFEKYFEIVTSSETEKTTYKMTA